MPTLASAIKEVATVEVTATIADAAKAMADRGVGALCVTEGNQLVGIVTDRDVVVRCVAHGVPVDGRIDSVMTMEPVTIDADADVEDAVAAFAEHPFRRLPVVRDGELAGMITVDDLLVNAAQDLSRLCRPIVGETLFKAPGSDVPALP
ncbi:MAG: CBS domain-containing protein [Acidimicrobiia bacterium]